MKTAKVNRILLVDDSETNRLLVKNIFDSDDFEVVLANGGVPALKILKNQDIDLILLDIMMPEMDGFELLDEIKKDKKIASIPVVMLTAKGNPASIKKAQESGVKDYIKKPIDIDDLILRVRRALQTV